MVTIVFINFKLLANFNDVDLVLAYTDRYVTLRGYSDSSDEEERVPVVTAVMAIDLDDGTTIILIMNEVLWLGNSQYRSLLNLNQVWYAGHQADDIPLSFPKGV